MAQRDTGGRAAALPRPGAGTHVADVPLLAKPGTELISGQFLTRVAPVPGESRRDALARLSAWARASAMSAVVLEDRAGQLYADFRALGFDDAGPMPRYAAPAQPGPVRRALTAVLLPGRRALPDVEAVPERLPQAAEHALRKRLASEFGALAFPSEDLPESGVHLVRGGGAVASCRYRVAETGGATRDLEVTQWIAPPGEPDLAALLARETLKAARRAGAATAVFGTTHSALAKGLLLARFLPRRSRARVLVRQSGDREVSAPSTADWHLTAPTVVGECADAPEAV